MLGIRTFGEHHMCSSLVDACQKYVRRHFTEVSEAVEFQELNLKDLLETIADDELHVSSEEQVSPPTPMNLVNLSWAC